MSIPIDMCVVELKNDSMVINRSSSLFPIESSKGIHTTYYQDGFGGTSNDKVFRKDSLTVNKSISLSTSSIL